MRTIKITIEYEGTHYCGWQMQQNGVSVQEKITNAINSVMGEQTTLHGSGRTDAGVHARGQCASFKTQNTIPVQRIPLALNAYLPADIAIVAAEDRDAGFHARYSAIGKKYSYQLGMQPYRSPLKRLYSWQLRKLPDIDKMRQALTLFQGTHDFVSFRATRSDIRNTVRTIWTTDLSVKDESCWISFEGNGFLYKMVRMLVASTVQVGLGRKKLSDIEERLHGKEVRDHKLTAPPQGLFLDKVYYQRDELPDEAELDDKNGKSAKIIVENRPKSVDTRGSMY